jgi:hypothetical protein
MPAARAKSAKKKDRVADAAVEWFAARSHAAWRRKFLETNPDQRNQPRMRMRGGIMVDINQPWEKLHPKAKADNKLAAYTAYEATRKFPHDREAAADYVHKVWIKRNKNDKNQPKHLFKPYAELSEAEKDKDRAHIDTMTKAIAAVQKRLRAPAQKTPVKAAARPPNLKFTASDLRRLEAARKKLSQALDGPVPLEALIVASAEAAASLSATLNSKPKSKRR